MQNDNGFSELVLEATILEFNDVLIFGNPLLDTDGYIKKAKDNIRKRYELTINHKADE